MEDHVVVVGAGAAGLSATVKLAERATRPLKITLMEANSCVGGRIRTVLTQRSESNGPQMSDRLPDEELEKKEKLEEEKKRTVKMEEEGAVRAVVKKKEQANAARLKSQDADDSEANDAIATKADGTITVDETRKEAPEFVNETVNLTTQRQYVNSDDVKKCEVFDPWPVPIGAEFVHGVDSHLNDLIEENHWTTEETFDFCSVEDYPSSSSFVNRHPSLNRSLSGLQRQKGHVKVFGDGQCWDLHGRSRGRNGRSSRYPLLIRRAIIIWEELSEIGERFCAQENDEESISIPPDMSVAAFVERQMSSEPTEDMDVVKSIVDSMYAKTAGTSIEFYGVNEACREEWDWEYTESNWRTQGCFSELIFHYLDVIDRINLKADKGEGIVRIKLMLNCPVESIDSVYVGSSSIPKVKVSPHKNCWEEHFVCDKAIVTVPLSILKANKISFEGEFALPPQKRFAVEKVNMFSGMKAHILLKKEVDIVGKADIVDFIELIFCPKEIFTQVWMRRDDSSLFVTGFVVADGRDELKNRIDGGESAEVLFLDQLKRMLVDQRKGSVFINESNPTCSAFALHDWSEDEFVMGMYSSPSVGAGWQEVTFNEQEKGDLTGVRSGGPKEVAQTCRHFLAQPIKDTVFFAGEHANTSTCASVQAALESGIAAAEETISSLGKANHLLSSKG